MTDGERDRSTVMSGSVMSSTSPRQLATHAAPASRRSADRSARGEPGALPWTPSRAQHGAGAVAVDELAQRPGGVLAGDGLAPAQREVGVLHRLGDLRDLLRGLADRV